MVRLQDGQITQIMPEYLARTDEARALSYALHRAVQRLLIHCGNIGVAAAIGTLPDDALDLLALEMGTQYYDSGLDLAAKRRLIKNTLAWYMGGGTPKAVEELVAAVFGKGEVSEWFEYGDAPYFFKITTNATMTPEMGEMFAAMIGRVKNERSHVRSVSVEREVAVRPSAVLLAASEPSIAFADGPENGETEAVAAGHAAACGFFSPHITIAMTTKGGTGYGTV